MAITFSSGFNVTSMEPIDVRLVLTKEQMLKTVYAKMPETYFAVCCDEDEDKGKIFIFNKSNEKDPVTGKFRKFESGLDPRVDDILTRLDEDEADIEEALAEIKATNDYINENFLTKFEIAETYEKKDDLASDLPSALVKALEEEKDEIESAVSGILPGALAKALDVQADKNSGLVVDENGNIKVSLNEEHLNIIDNKIDLALECIQAIDGNDK